MGVSEKFFSDFEAEWKTANHGDGLKMLAHAGFDVLWIMLNLRNEIGREDGRVPGDEVRHALNLLPGVERQRLLLHFSTIELKRLVAPAKHADQMEGKR